VLLQLNPGFVWIFCHDPPDVLAPATPAQPLPASVQAALTAMQGGVCVFRGQVR